MPLKIDPHQTFEATPEINLEGFKASFGIKCKLLDLDALSVLQKQWNGVPAVYADPANDIAKGVAPITPRIEPTIEDREFIDAWLVGFAADVVGADDQPLPFTPDNVTILLKTPGAKMAVINAFFKGYQQAEAKNSVRPLAG